MRKIFAFVAALSVAAVAFIAGGVSPASAHGTWPDGSSTGYRNTLDSPIGDQIFTSACGSPPCLHVLQDDHIVGKIVVGDGHFVAVVDSLVESDGSDTIAVETTGTGGLQFDHSTISGDYVTAAYGRNMSIKWAEITGVTGTGVILNARSELRESWLHDFATDSIYPMHGVQIYDVWEGCQNVNIPDGCNNPSGPDLFSTTVYHNFIQLDGNQWSAITAQPAFGTNPTAAQWYVMENFFVGGASEAVHIEDQNGDLAWLNVHGNHVMTGSSITIEDYDIGCGNEWDNYSTASAMSAPLGTAC